MSLAKVEQLAGNVRIKTVADRRSIAQAAVGTPGTGRGPKGVRGAADSVGGVSRLGAACGAEYV